MQHTDLIIQGLLLQELVLGEFHVQPLIISYEILLIFLENIQVFVIDQQLGIVLCFLQ